MKCITLGLVGILLLGFSSSLQAQETDAEKAFKAYAELMVGGVWKLDTDDGNQIVHRYRWILEETFLERTDEGGNRSAKTIIGIDPATNKLTLWHFSSTGAVGKITMSQEKDGVWDWESAGALVGRGTFTGKGRTSKVGNDEVREEWFDTVIGGQKREPRTMTFTRQKQ